MQRNDCVLEALGSGQYNDLLHQYYKDNGAVSPQINDAEYEFLIAQGVVGTDHLNDMWFELLSSLGYSGSLSDMQHEFWCVDGGAVIPPTPTIFTFAPTAAGTGGVDISLPAGKEIVIDWGDGNTTTVTGAVDNVNYTNDYAAAGSYPVKFSGDYKSVTRLSINTLPVEGTLGDIGKLSGLDYLYISGDNTISGLLSKLSPVLTSLHITGSNTISGDIANSSQVLTYMYITGSNTITGSLSSASTVLSILYLGGFNTITGDMAGISPVLTSIHVTGSNTITGDIADAPNGLTYLRIQGSNTITGDIADAPNGLTYLYITGLCAISGYTTRTWTTRPATFIMVTVSPGGLSTTEIDHLLIDLDADLTWSGGTINLTGTNAPRSTISDAAVVSLESQGVTVTVNGVIDPPEGEGENPDGSPGFNPDGSPIENP